MVHDVFLVTKTGFVNVYGASERFKSYEIIKLVSVLDEKSFLRIFSLVNLL